MRQRSRVRGTRWPHDLLDRSLRPLSNIQIRIRISQSDEHFHQALPSCSPHLPHLIDALCGEGGVGGVVSPRHVDDGVAGVEADLAVRVLQ